MKLPLHYGLAALATWRVTHLLVHEDGPAETIARLREHLGDSQLGALMDCFYCTSMWVAIPFALFVAKKPTDRLVAWLALSGMACLIDELTRTGVEEEGRHDELLRTETASA